MGRDTLEAFGFSPYQFDEWDGDYHFTPHWESDSYTADELRFIASILDKKKLDKLP